MKNPGNDHWKAIKWILRHLREMSDYSLCYGFAGWECIGYDFAVNWDKRRSTTCYVFSMDGSVIRKESKLQLVVIL